MQSHDWNGPINSATFIFAMVAIPIAILAGWKLAELAYAAARLLP